MIRAVLFDFYDTLATAPWSHLEMLLADRMSVPAEDVRQGFHSIGEALLTGRFDSIEADVEAMAAACGMPAEPRLIDDLVDIEVRFLGSQVALFDDAEPTMHHLREAGVATAIVSNCSRTTAPLMEQLGLSSTADLVVMSYQVGAAKPSAAIYEYALRGLGVRPGEALFVDDQVGFLDGARRSGLATVQIVHDQSSNDRPPSGGHEVINNLSELLMLV
ncbi:MAG: HAD-IA family hydrolase [Actinomycetota bacterium]|nr:HAD-IA family hydrolase [Actinomycetota bacterium]